MTPGQKQNKASAAYLLLASSLALSFLLQGGLRPQEAVAAFGLEDSPMDNRLAAMDQIHRGDKQAALESYATAIEAATKKFGSNSTFLADLYYEAGSLASQMDQFETAENHLRKAIQINPRLSMARIELANVCRRRDKPTEALEQIQRDLGNHPNSLVARQQFIRWLGQNGKTLTDKSIAHQESLRLLAISQSANMSGPGAVKAPPVTLPKIKPAVDKAAEEKARQETEKAKQEAEKAKAELEKSKTDADNAEKNKQEAFRRDLEERARRVERAARAEKERLERQERQEKAARAEKAARTQKPVKLPQPKVEKKPESKPEEKPEVKPESNLESNEQVAKTPAKPDKSKKVAAEQVAPRQQAPAAVPVLPGMFIPVSTGAAPVGKRAKGGLVPPPPATTFGPTPFYPAPMMPMPPAQQQAPPKPKKEKPKAQPKKVEEEPEEKAAPSKDSGAAPTDQDAEFMLDWAELKSKKGKGK